MENGYTPKEEQWKNLLLDRLQKLENLSDDLKTSVGDIRTTNAVANFEGKTRSETQQRFERDLADVSKSVHELEKKSERPPTGWEDLNKRLKDLEEWRHNIMGRLVVATALIMIIVSAAVSAIFKLVGA